MKKTVHTTTRTVITLSAKEIAKLIANHINQHEGTNVTMHEDIAFKVNSYGLLEGAQLVIRS